MNDQRIIPTAEPFLLTAGKTGCVLVHGFTGSPKEMRPLGDALYKNGITALGVRLAGHATSPKDLVRTRWEDWLISVEDGIHLISSICSAVFIAGLSMGGMLSLIAAARYPILKGAIAMAAPYTLGNDWRLNLTQPLSLFVPEIKKDKRAIKKEKQTNGHVDYQAYPTRAIGELHQLTGILRESLGEIDIPALLVHSKDDQTVPKWHAEKIAQGLRAASVERLELEKSGHVITEDMEAGKVFDAAVDFINRHKQAKNEN